MAGLEELMAGLFGSNMAPGLEDERRRRNAPGGGGYDGIGGAMVTPGMMMPYYSGLPTYDFSGAMGRDFGQGGGRGLQSMLSGPALRHFARQGFDFNPPGQDNRENPGGPNMAPGNIDNAQALYQPNGNPTPGIPQGVARGFDEAPGQMRPTPHTQGWRNVAPGYSAAAQYGFGSEVQGQFGGGVRQGAPAAQAAPPPGATGGGGKVGGPGAGGGGGGGAPQSQNAIGGGPGPVSPAGPRGGGGGGTGGGQSGGGKQTGGGAPAPGTEHGGVQGGGSIGTTQFQGTIKQQRRQARGNAYQNAQQGNASGTFGDTIHVAPNGGNNNTPSETGGGPPKWSDTHTATHAGETAAEKKARLAAKAARQEAARVKAAPSASSFGANSATNDRGSGLAPLPKAGKTKPTNVGRYGGKRR